MDAFLDVVVQRLFATGMGIEAIVAQLEDRELADRLSRHVSDLDETTEEIRRAIGLRDGTEAGSYGERHVPSTASAVDVVF
jgi:signal transduction histidine kinase